MYCINFDRNEKQHFLYQPIFYTQNINVSSEISGSRKLQNAQIFLIYQIYSKEENKILTKEEIKTKYSIDLDFISFKHIENGLKRHSLYGKCTENIRNNLKMTCYGQRIFRNERGSQNIYACLLPKHDDSRVTERWKRYGIENIEWKKVHKIVDKSLDCTKLKWMQLRINNKILSTNKSVSKFKEDQSPLCTFCNAAEEDIPHLLYDCRVVQRFWRNLEHEIIAKCPTITFIKIPKQVAIFGAMTNFYSDPIFDLILAMAKYYIYRQKVKNEILNLSTFILELKNRFLADKYNATLQSNNNYEAKWQIFKPLFSEQL